MVLGILAEPASERRVSVAPVSIEPLLKLGIESILVEGNAGKWAHFTDEQYGEKGAKTASAEEILKGADVIIRIHPFSETEWKALTTPKVVLHQVGMGDATRTGQLAQAGGHTLLSIDLIPRTTRAQAMDVLSSMATVAGYEAVLLSATHFNRFFPMFMSAAGTIPPAKVLVLGAGVAGLQAIATAKKLGAVVEAFDVRTAAREEAESIGAKFIEVEGAAEEREAGGYAIEQTEDYLRKQKQLIYDHAIKSDIIICTAQIPGRPAPVLIPENTLDAMRPGSVLVDLAASTGGNCAATSNNETIDYKGITIIGDSNLAARMPADASIMYGRNLTAYMKLFFADGQWQFPLEDDIVAASCVTHKGEFISERFKQLYL